MNSVPYTGIMRATETKNGETMRNLQQIKQALAEHRASCSYNIGEYLRKLNALQIEQTQAVIASLDAGHPALETLNNELADLLTYEVAQ